MALQKSEDFKGIKANYWKVVNSEENYITNSTVVRVGLFVSDATREDNITSYLKTSVVSLGSTDLNRKDIYTELKASGCYWNDAKDC